MSTSPADEIKVLLIDDERDFLGLAERFFEKRGEKIRLDTSTSAEEGLEILKKGNHDVVVADYKMPDMDGLELLDNLRSSGDDIPFILLTGRGREEVAMKALNKGADRYHIKGEDLETQFRKLLKSIIEEIVRKKSETELKTFQKWIKSTLSSESERKNAF